MIRTILLTLMMFCCPVVSFAQQQGGLGINDMAIWRTRDALDIAFKQYADSGTKFLRIGADWNAIESPAKGQFRELYTDRLDYFFEKAAEAGIRVLLISAYAPEWANGGHKGSGYAPVNPDDFADYTEWLLRRYAKYKDSQGVRTLEAIELWNEPDLADIFFKPYKRFSKESAELYGKMVVAAGTRLKMVRKEIDADDVLILAPVVADPHGAAWHKWMEAFYATPGVTDCYDVFSWHSYWQSAGSTGWLPPELPACYDPEKPERSVMGKVTTDRGLLWPLMVKAGDDKKPNWCTEIGGSAKEAAADHKNRLLSFDEQAVHLKDAIDTFKAGKITNMHRVYWFTMFDNPYTTGDQPYFGLVACNESMPIAYPEKIPLTQSKLTPKPAYSIYRDASKAFPLGSNEATSP